MRQDFRNEQQQRNSETAGLADSYAGHRENVMRLITATANDLGGGPDQQLSSVVLLGAGNCLDVDLPQLAGRFQKIHLIDVDEDAVTAAVRKSGVAEQCDIHAPADIAEPLLSLTSRDFRSTDENREHRIQILQLLTAPNALAEIPEADVVVSLCVFSQIIGTLGRIVSQNHPTFENTLKAVRIGHLRRMINMLRPGGVAVFVSDVVSSESAPELLTTTSQALPELVRTLVNDGNFFSGTNPALMLADLNLLSRLPGGPDTVHTIDPWLWHMGERAYAVYAFRIQKQLPESDDGAEIDPAL
ncbi:MAG: hypothetical protein R3C59_12720 [Planctomycetaceae bacterium]